MKVYVAFLVLGLCVLVHVAVAKPNGGKKGGRDRGAERGTGDVTGDRHGKGGKRGGKGGREPRPDRPNKQGRGQQPDVPVDPVCENLNCERPTRETLVCGTDGQTYRSECLLIKDRCRGRIATDVEVATPGRCESPDGTPLKPNGKEGRHGGKKGRPGKGRWPKECVDFIDTTMEPGTVADESVCTAVCPIATAETPLQQVCGTDAKTYESSCVLELIGCVTNNMELSVASEGACQ